MEEMHVSPVAVALIGSFLGMLLSIIAFFLSRLLKQFDNLTAQVSNLNSTMQKIDKDLSGDVGIIQTRLAGVEAELEDMDPLWDRTRKCEEKIVALETRMQTSK